jgi:hypothetical protein
MVICFRFPQYFEHTKQYFCQLLNVHGINDVSQMEMDTAESLVHERSPFQAEIAIENLKDINHWVLTKFR